ncbi:MAG: TraR/DksA C4-type zinc finger protein [Pseudomonadota bacterium]
MTIDVSHFEKLLQERRAYLADRLQKYEDSLDQKRSSNTSERALEQENDEVLEGLGETGLTELRMIDAALHKIEDGTYGMCVNCEEDIAPERLELVPHAAVCANCARG